MDAMLLTPRPGCCKATHQQPRVFSLVTSTFSIRVGNPVSAADATFRVCAILLFDIAGLRVSAILVFDIAGFRGRVTNTGQGAWRRTRSTFDPKSVRIPNPAP